MSRQKSRIGSDGSDAALAEKKKARHRLVGAVALCLLAAIVVPMLLESEPRNAERALPLRLAEADQDMPLDERGMPPPPPPPGEPEPNVPDRLVMLEDRHVPTAPSLEGQPPAAVPAPPGQPPAMSPGAAGGRQPQHGAATPGTPPRPVLPPARPPAPPSEPPDVLARLIDQVNPGTGGAARPGERQNRRFLLQVGAYSNVKSARLASDRVGKAGMTAYHETVKTANGDWIRVRIGPFDSREAAEQAQQTLKRAGVTAALIAL